MMRIGKLVGDSVRSLYRESLVIGTELIDQDLEDTHGELVTVINIRKVISVDGYTGYLIEFLYSNKQLIYNTTSDECVELV